MNDKRLEDFWNSLHRDMVLWRRQDREREIAALERGRGMKIGILGNADMIWVPGEDAIYINFISSWDERTCERVDTMLVHPDIPYRFGYPVIWYDGFVYPDPIAWEER